MDDLYFGPDAVYFLFSLINICAVFITFGLAIAIPDTVNFFWMKKGVPSKFLVSFDNARVKIFKDKGYIQQLKNLVLFLWQTPLTYIHKNWVGCFIIVNILIFMKNLYSRIFEGLIEIVMPTPTNNSMLLIILITLIVNPIIYPYT